MSWKRIGLLLIEPYDSREGWGRQPVVGSIDGFGIIKTAFWLAVAIVLVIVLARLH